MFSDVAISLELFLAASAIQLALGGFFGWLLHSGRKPAIAATPADQTQQAQDMMQRLHALASSIGHNVGQHASKVEGISKELSEAAARGDDDAQSAVLSAVAKIAEANERLQGQLRQAEQKLEEQGEQLQSKMVEARTDALTNLANRRAFDDEVQQRLTAFSQQREPSCMLLVDVDHFKKFNDTYGHLAGDATLRGVSRVLYDSMRGVDLVARYGGEEFAVIMPRTTLSEARRLAERARAAVAEASFDFEGQTLKVTLSGGVCEVFEGAGAEEWIKRADEALYTSKQAGRNCIHLHNGNGCQRIQSHAEQHEHVAAPAPAPAAPAEAKEPQRATETAGASIAPAAVHSGAIALVDNLTNLATRVAFEEAARPRMAMSLHAREPICLVLADIDGLEAINQRFGTKGGDMVLRAVSQFLTAARRAGRDADLLARFDADQFAVLLPGCDLRDATDTAERLHRAIALCKLRLGESDLQFTISIAVVKANLSDDIDGLVRRAHSTLEAAKFAGQNITFVSYGQRCAAAHTVFSNLEDAELAGAH